MNENQYDKIERKIKQPDVGSKASRKGHKGKGITTIGVVIHSDHQERFFKVIMQGRDTAAPPPAMYLAYEHWSPRYETTFYTVKVEGFEMLNAAPENLLKYDGGKSNHPAFYYKLDVFCGHNKRSILRRYSEFKALLGDVPRSNVDDDDRVAIPPGTCFCYPQQQQESFAQNRLEQLREFMRHLLQQPTVASHPAVMIFLELDKISEN